MNSACGWQYEKSKPSDPKNWMSGSLVIVLAQVVDAVAALLELLHQRLHPAAGAEHAHPVVQHALHLEAPAHGSGPLEHPLVGLPAGDAARVQQPPFSAAEGQVVDLLFQPPVPEQVDEVPVGVEIHHDAAEVEHFFGAMLWFFFL